LVKIPIYLRRELRKGNNKQDTISFMLRQNLELKVSESQSSDDKDDEDYVDRHTMWIDADKASSPYPDKEKSSGDESDDGDEKEKEKEKEDFKSKRKCLEYNENEGMDADYRDVDWFSKKHKQEGLFCLSTDIDSSVRANKEKRSMDMPTKWRLSNCIMGVLRKTLEHYKRNGLLVESDNLHSYPGVSSHKKEHPDFASHSAMGLKCHILPLHVAILGIYNIETFKKYNTSTVFRNLYDSLDAHVSRTFYKEEELYVDFLKQMSYNIESLETTAAFNTIVHKPIKAAVVDLKKLQETQNMMLHHLKVMEERISKLEKNEDYVKSLEQKLERIEKRKEKNSGRLIKRKITGKRKRIQSENQDDQD